MGKMNTKGSRGRRYGNCSPELRDILIEFGFLRAPGVLFEPVARGLGSG